jgi:hypothetical protein
VSLPVNARVEAVQSFVRSLRATEAFMLQQDAASAQTRYAALLVQLAEARQHLRWNPAAGRPARFHQMQSAQGRVVAARAAALAASHGLAQLRELVLKPYLLLYAHGADRVVLLALKHERELAFQLR